MASAPPSKPDVGPGQPPAQLSPLATCAVCFGIGNLLGPPIVVAIVRGGNETGVTVVAVSFGVLLAQFGVLPAWLVWGERPFWQRFIIHWTLACGLALAWVLGLMMVVGAHGTPGPPENFSRDLGMMFLCLPGVSLGIEAPM